MADLDEGDGAAHLVVHPWRLLNGEPHQSFLAALRAAIIWNVHQRPGVSTKGVIRSFPHLLPLEVRLVLDAMVVEGTLSTRAMGSLPATGAALSPFSPEPQAAPALEARPGGALYNAQCYFFDGDVLSTLAEEPTLAL